MPMLMMTIDQFVENAACARLLTTYCSMQFKNDD